MNNDKDALGTRMKEYYEYPSRIYLTRRTPVIIRIDGKAFHTFTRGFEKPFDDIMVKSMQETMRYLCENIQGCALGYTQSDEISLLLIDYNELDTCAWFNYNIQKCASIAASMATLAFNGFFNVNYSEWCVNNIYAPRGIEKEDEKTLRRNSAYDRASQKGAMFDARVFNIPKEEVCNYFLWRQNDASRNSIESVGQAYFSHNELDKKKLNDIQDMLMEKFNVNWNNYATHLKRGSCCRRNLLNRKWYIDKEIPIFKGDGRDYIDELVYVGE